MLDIRTIAAEEMEEASRISADAFGSSNRPDFAQAVEQQRRFFPADWHLASFEDGEMTSMMRMLPFAMRINGRGLPFAAVGPVANSPRHRRKGHTGAMLRQSLELMRDRGQWLCGLYTPHPAFYRRYGWEIAADERIYTFKPKDGRLTLEPRERGRLRDVKPADWQRLDTVHRRWGAERNGPLHRGEVWWRNAVLGESEPAMHDTVLWEDGAGEAQGYAVISQPAQGPDANRVIVRELVAVTADAYLNLVAFVAMHDIHHEVRMTAPSDDPLPLLFADTDRLTVAQGYTVLLRLVDVEAALRARPAVTQGVDADFTLAVRDASAGWNEGVYRLRLRDGAVEVERGSGEGDLDVDAKTLAPIFNGYVSPSSAAAAGLLRVSDFAALSQADAFFAARYRPFFWDRF